MNMSRKNSKAIKRKQKKLDKFWCEIEERTLLRRGNIVIPYPIKKSEAEIQAMIWSKLIAEGIDARIEVHHTIKNPGGGIYRKQISRFDIVVFKDKEAIIIIEVKLNRKSMRKVNEQRQKYEAYKGKLIYCFGEEEIEQTMEEVRKCF